MLTKVDNTRLSEWIDSLCRSDGMPSVQLREVVSVTPAVAEGSTLTSMRQQLICLDGDGQATAPTSRKDMLRAVAAGEPIELEIALRAFQQVPGEFNANHVRFNTSILGELAKSFQGQPLLRDHNTDELDARGGTITSAKAVKLDSGGAGFDMTASVTAPWAVSAILRGNLDRFSIGWSHGGMDTVTCSLCDSAILTECDHFPGDKVSDENGDEHVVEFIFNEAAGREVSGVSSPAVSNTGIQDIRAALSEVAKTAQPKKEEKRMSLKAINEALGLSADATQADVVEALKARELASTLLDQQNAELISRAEAAEAAGREASADALILEFSGCFGDDEKSIDLRKRYRELASKDIAAARGLLESMPKLAKHAIVSGGLQSGTSSVQEVSVSGPWNQVIASQLAALGVSKEEYEEYGSHNSGVDLFSQRRKYKQALARKERTQLRETLGLNRRAGF